MKKIVLTTLVFFCVFNSYSFIKSSGCDSEVLYQETLRKITNCTLVKDYRVYLKKKKKAEPIPTTYFPITLNRGVKYKFWCAQSPEYPGILNISLYASRGGKPDFLFATNYRPDNGKTYESFEIELESTLNCLISFSYIDGNEGCGLGILSISK